MGMTGELHQTDTCGRKIVMLDATSSPIIVSIVNTLETALTPVFLLAGTAGFLNAFVSRLSRISDRVNSISELIEKEHEINEDRFAQLNYLRIRTLALEIAVLLGTSAGHYLTAGRRDRTVAAFANTYCIGSFLVQ